MGANQPPDARMLLGSGSRRLLVQAIAYAGTMTASALSIRQRSAVAQEATPDASAGLPALAGRTYIGGTSDPNTFVAVIVPEADAGATDREARAYVCNGADVVEWFDEGGVTGEGEGQIDLRSENGAHLVGTVSAEAATGMITLADGAALTFDAPLATGPDGLYTFTVTPDGFAEGSSAAGALLEGQLILTGTITLPSGEASNYQWPVLIDDVSDLRTIYRAESGQRGSGKTRKGTRMVVQP